MPSAEIRRSLSLSRSLALERTTATLLFSGGYETTCVVGERTGERAMDIRFLCSVAAAGIGKSMMFRSIGGHPYPSAAAAGVPGSVFGGVGSLRSPSASFGGFYSSGKEFPCGGGGGVGQFAGGVGHPSGPHHPSLLPGAVVQGSVPFSIDCLLTASDRPCSPITTIAANGRCVSSSGPLRLRRHSGSTIDKSGRNRLLPERRATPSPSIAL